MRVIILKSVSYFRPKFSSSGMEISTRTGIFTVIKNFPDIENSRVVMLRLHYFRFLKEVSSWLKSGKEYRLKTFVVTKSSDANMSNELKGASIELEATYFDNIPEMNPFSLVAGDSQMTVCWDALSDFEMPEINLKYDVFMDNALIASELSVLEHLKTGLMISQFKYLVQLFFANPSGFIISYSKSRSKYSCIISLFDIITFLVCVKLAV